MQQKFKISSCHKKFVTRLMGKSWRNHKSNLSSIIKQLADCPNVAEELARKKPIDVGWDEWQEFHKIRTAEIAFTDPQAFVHHVPLGPDCYKVWVKEIPWPNVPLFRHSNEFSNLDEAREGTIAWPHKYISFD